MNMLLELYKGACNYPLTHSIALLVAMACLCVAMMLRQTRSAFIGLILCAVIVLCVSLLDYITYLDGYEGNKWFIVIISVLILPMVPPTNIFFARIISLSAKHFIGNRKVAVKNYAAQSAAAISAYYLIAIIVTNMKMMFG